MNCSCFHVNDSRFLFYLASVEAAFRRDKERTGQGYFQGVGFLGRAKANGAIEVFAYGGDGVIFLGEGLAFWVQGWDDHAYRLRLYLAVKDFKDRSSNGASAYRAGAFFADFRYLLGCIWLYVRYCRFVMDLYCFNGGHRPRYALHLCELRVFDGANQAHPARVSPGIRFP